MTIFPLDLSDTELSFNPLKEPFYAPSAPMLTDDDVVCTPAPIEPDPTIDPSDYTPEFLPTEEDGTPSHSLTGLANKVLRDQAKSLYFHANQSLTEISETLDTPLHELKRYVYGKHHDDWQRNPKCWAYQKQYVPQLSVARYEKIEPILVKSSMKSTIRVMIRNLQRLETEEDILDIKDIKGLMDIYGQLDKIRRLTDGLATENLGVDRSTWTMREVMEERRKANPFMTDCPDSQSSLDQSPDVPEVIEEVEYKTMEVSR